LPKEVWDDPHPQWEEKTLHPELADILQEEPFSPELTERNCTVYRGLEIPTQIYTLIQKMRYCIIPLECFFSNQWQDWTEWFYNTGCINQPQYYWNYNRRLKVIIPEYWRKENTQYKIGVYAKNTTPGDAVPVNGSFWKNAAEYTTPGIASTNGISDVRIYGAIDLSTHPDFKKYIDIYDSPEES
jgi:hypothetical protein